MCACVCVCVRTCACSAGWGVNTLAASPSVASASIYPVAALRTRWLFSGCHWLPRTPRKHLVLPRLMRLEGFQPAVFWASRSVAVEKCPSHGRKPSGRASASLFAFKVNVSVVHIIAHAPSKPQGGAVLKKSGHHLIRWLVWFSGNAGVVVAQSHRSTAREPTTTGGRPNVSNPVTHCKLSTSPFLSQNNFNLPWR